MIGLVQPYYEWVGFKDSPSDPHFTIYSRIDATEWACKLQIADCETKAKQEYAALMNDIN